jgi:plastocyanin
MTIGEGGIMRNRLWVGGWLGMILAAAVATAAEKPGHIRGTVRFTGEVPAAKKVPTGDGAIIEHNDLVADPKTKGLRWVIAVLEDAPAQPKLQRAEPAVIDQKDMLFVPRIVAIQHGQPVRFDNSDPCNHSVRTLPALKENEMNVFVTAAQPVTKTFSVEKAPIQVGCSLHGWMTAWVHVAPHPWSTVTDEKGTFALRDVPPGKYTLLLRHPDTGVQERRQVDVKAGETVEVAFEWKDAKPKRDKK